MTSQLWLISSTNNNKDTDVILIVLQLKYKCIFYDDYKFLIS